MKHYTSTQVYRSLILSAFSALLIGVVAFCAPRGANAVTMENIRSYACSNVSVPSVVYKDKGIYTAKVSYKNTSNYATTFTASNTNPVMFIKSGSTIVGGDTPVSPTSYSVGRGGAFTATFTSGTGNFTRGKTYSFKFVLYEASSNNSLYLMSGTPCTKSFTVK